MNGDGEIRWLDGRAFIGVIYELIYFRYMLMIKNMEEVHLYGQMVENMLEIGLKVNSKVMEHIIFQIQLLNMVNG